MSYDYPDGYVPPPPPPWTLRGWLTSKYWGFIIWCALDAPSKRVNDWGIQRIYKGK